MTDNRLAEIKARIARRHDNSEDHSPIDVHPALPDGSLDVSTIMHRLCLECSDDDVIATLEFGDMIDAGDGEHWPCPAADVDWLVGEVELLRRQVDVMAKALQLDADNLRRALAAEAAPGGAA